MADTEFEARVREAIAHGTSGEAPTDLVARVHRRATGRRRRTATGFVAGATAVAAVVVVTSQLTGVDPDDRATTSPSPSVAVERGWRVESWHDVQVEVPDDWVYASRSQWCTMSSRQDGWQVPRVWRSDQPETKVRCSEPVESYGLTFIDTTVINLQVDSGAIQQYGDGGELPEGAWYATVLDGKVAVAVAAADRETVEHIVDSVDPVRGANAVDANGCFPKSERSFRAEPLPGTVSVCRYGDGLWLSQSERLEGGDAAATVAALDAAPVIDYVPCPTPKVPDPSIELVTPDGVAKITWGFCTGVYWKDAKRELTPDLMYWALSPGFQGPLPGNVPWPDPLRS